MMRKEGRGKGEGEKEARGGSSGYYHIIMYFGNVWHFDAGYGPDLHFEREMYYNSTQTLRLLMHIYICTKLPTVVIINIIAVVFVILIIIIILIIVIISLHLLLFSYQCRHHYTSKFLIRSSFQPLRHD